MMKPTPLFVRWLLLALVVVGLGSCRKQDDASPTPAPLSGQESFVSADVVATMPKAQLQTLASLAGFGTFLSQLKYDVKFYKIQYKTTYQGKLVTVSGTLAVPLSPAKAPAMLSAQHGTMFRYADAPSNFPATFTGFELFACAGFITVIPDYIGLGVSQSLGQTFYDKPTSAGAVVDMIKAARYYLDQQKIDRSQRLFLVGYSEGGYTTMAAQQEIETNAQQGLTLTGVAAGAGGYDLTGMLNGVATASTYATPAFLALFLDSYNRVYSWNRPLADFYPFPYAARIPALLDGTKVRDEIDAALTPVPSALFAPAFFASLTSASSEPALKQKLQDNSFANWVPKSPTRLYHGTNDESVFYQTSVSTFTRFQTAGATNVTFTPIPGGTHQSSIVPMMSDVLPWLQSLDQ